MSKQQGNLRQRAESLTEQIAVNRTLATGEFLFREGDFKTHLYRVESGCVCMYAPAGRTTEPFLEFAYGGDWMGFGYLERHVWRARVIGRSVVSCFPRTMVNVLIDHDARARAALHNSLHREFALVQQTTATPEKRH